MKTLQEIEHDILEVQRTLRGISEDVYSLKINEATKPTEPEFKVGDWVIGLPEISPEYPVRILGFYEDRCRYSDSNDGIEDNGQALNNLRHATKEEIETYLRKVCDEKYVGKKVKSINSGELRIPSFFSKYDDTDDTLYYDSYTSGGDVASVYRQGKFAEIIEDKKRKPTPKTKEELIADYERWLQTTDTTSFQEFIDFNYED